MGSTERKSGKPVLSRRNTFQHMLDLEQQNKVNRMSAVPTRTSQPPLPPSSDLPGLLYLDPVPLRSKGPSATSPSLSPVRPPGHVLKDVTPSQKSRLREQLRPHEPHQAEIVEAGQESDASSICRSPGWDDISGRKRDKEKREAKDRRRRDRDMFENEAKRLKKEAERAEVESKRREREKAEAAVKQLRREKDKADAEVKRKNRGRTDALARQVKEKEKAEGDAKKHEKERAEALAKSLKEKEKAEADARKKADLEAKQAQKKQRRLSKAPPSSNRLSRLSMTDRSVSAPIVPNVLPTIQSPGLPEPAQEAARGREAQGQPGRVRRGSVEMEVSSFISATQAVPVSWQSTASASLQSARTRSSSNRRTSDSTSTGFIGGLKLRQSEESTRQDDIRTQTVVLDDYGRGPTYDESKLVLNLDLPRNSSKERVAAAAAAARSSLPLPQESSRSTEQWDSIYAQAAKLAHEEAAAEQDSTTAMMDRNVRRARKSHQPPPTSGYWPLGLEVESPEGDYSAGLSQKSPSSAHSSGGDTTPPRFPMARRPNSGFSDRPPLSSGNRSESHERSAIGDHQRGRATQSYVHQRQNSFNQAVADFADIVASEATKTKDGHSARSSIFSRSKERMRRLSRSRDRSSNRLAGEPASNPPSLLNNYEPPTIVSQLRVPPTLLPVETSSHSRKRSDSSGLGDLVSAAKGIFSKRPHSRTTSSVESAAEDQPPRHEKPVLETRADTVDALNGQAPKPLTQAQRITGEFAPAPTVHDDFALKLPASKRESAQEEFPMRPHAISSTEGSALDVQSELKSSTESSEGYSGNEEFSNLTTPTITRPPSQQSYLSYLPGADVINLRIPSPAVTEKVYTKLSEDSRLSLPTMTAAAFGAARPFDEPASGRESRQSLPTDTPELTDDEDRTKTPTGKKDNVDLPSPEIPELPKTASGIPSSESSSTSETPSSDSSNSELKRKPSISRSVSTPEMLDLSFLPALKHQALTPRAPKGKSNLGPKKSKSKSKLISPPPTPGNALTSPPPIPLLNHKPKSEGSYPTSPSYLQNARLSLPAAVRGPTTSALNPHKPPTPQLVAPLPLDPIAKMLVVCCSCKHMHDMPSKVYECMAKSDSLVEDRALGVSGVVNTSVKCPWCGHGMTTGCCAGYAAVVYLRERLH